MKTQYWGRDGVARTATYTCNRQNGWGEITHKVIVPARHIEHAVVEHALAALTTIDEETARSVVERSQLEQVALERAQRRRLLDADEDVQGLFQLLKSAPAELQSARNDLWAKYNTAVQHQLELKTQLATETAASLSLTPVDIGHLIQLTRNTRQLWESPQRTNDQKKQLLQTVITEIVVHRADREGADVEIVWKGALRQAVRVHRPRGVERRIADRTRTGNSIRAIADELNAEGAVTASGQAISPQLVARKQRHQGLHVKDERHLARQLIRRGVIENLPRPEILSQLREQAPRLGPWDPQRLSEAIRQLRRGVPGIDPLPMSLPANEEKQRVLALIERELAAGKIWTTIVAELNRTGLRPPRGHAFTPVQVRLLYMRAHGLRSFKLSGGPPTSEGASP